MKQTIKLRESELKRMIAESVKRVLNENDNSSRRRNALLQGDNLEDRWENYVKQRPRPYPYRQHDSLPLFFDGDKEDENQYSWDLLNDINNAWKDEEGNVRPGPNQPVQLRNYKPKDWDKCGRQDWIDGTIKESLIRGIVKETISRMLGR